MNDSSSRDPALVAPSASELPADPINDLSCLGYEAADPSLYASFLNEDLPSGASKKSVR